MYCSVYVYFLKLYCTVYLSRLYCTAVCLYICILLETVLYGILVQTVLYCRVSVYVYTLFFTELDTCLIFTDCTVLYCLYICMLVEAVLYCTIYLVKLYCTAGCTDVEKMSKTLLAMSSSPTNCDMMRSSRCIPLLVQLLHLDHLNPNLPRPSRHVRARAARCLHNIVHAHPTDKHCKREAKVLKLLEILRQYCDLLR